MLTVIAQYLYSKKDRQKNKSRVNQEYNLKSLTSPILHAIGKIKFCSSFEIHKVNRNFGNFDLGSAD